MDCVHIGNAVLILADCRDVVPGLQDIGTVVTDPPYGMAFRSNFRRVQHAAIANDCTDDMLQFACQIQAAHSRYVFCRWDNLAAVPRPNSVVTWVKNNWSMGDLKHEHARQTELILFYAGPEHVFPRGRPTDVVEAPRTVNENHPSEKPVQLMMTVLEWTQGLVLDPFMGSGTTGVACMRTGRPFVGIECDPEHFQTACRRIEAAHCQLEMFSQPAARAPAIVQPHLAF